jgi:prevent-host-death family protein
MREPAPRSAREVTLAELTRRTSAVLLRVQEGEIAVVTRHHRPIAILLGARFRALQNKRELDALYKARWYGPRKPPPLEP